MAPDVDLEKDSSSRNWCRIELSSWVVDLFSLERERDVQWCRTAAHPPVATTPEWPGCPRPSQLELDRWRWENGFRELLQVDCVSRTSSWLWVEAFFTLREQFQNSSSCMCERMITFYSSLETFSWMLELTLNFWEKRITLTTDTRDIISGCLLWTGWPFSLNI